MASAGVIVPARSAEDSEDEPEQLQYKVILLGDGAVGKTSIAMRFTEDHFAKAYKQTIGVKSGDSRCPKCATRAPPSRDRFRNL